MYGAPPSQWCGKLLPASLLSCLCVLLVLVLWRAVVDCVSLLMLSYSKKQATSETATYGSEFGSGRTCVEQVVDLRNSFRYLGVPVNDISYIFGDNESMINSSSFPHAKLNK